MKFNHTSQRSVIFNKLSMSTEALRSRSKILNIKSSCLHKKQKDSTNLLMKRMDLLLILKKINLTSILKSTITNLINKKYNNQKIISESINNKLITLKESWMDGKERPNKLMLRLKEFKENCSNMLRKKIVYPTC